MKRQTVVKGILLGVLVLSAAGASLSPVLGQTGGGYDLQWHTVDDGGGGGTGGPYAADGSIGQHDASVATGGGFALKGGFWFGYIPAAGDCNNDTKVDAGDLSALILEVFDADGSWASRVPESTFVGDPDGCDANVDGVVDAGDLSCTILIIFGGPGSC